jgi:hypothetical protein
MKKKVTIAITVGSLAVCVAIPYRMASGSVAVWQELRDAVSKRDYLRVRKVLEDDDRDLHEIRDDGVYYFGHEFNGRIERSRPDLRRTFKYYLLDWPRERHDKVIVLPLGDGGGYAIIEHGRITFMKFP